MTPIDIRMAVEADMAAIAAIYAQAVEQGTASFELEAPSPATMLLRWQTLVVDGYPYLVAESDGVIAGYAYAGAYRQRPAYHWTVEDSVYVHPDHAGKGIGKALLERLIDECEARGYRQMIAVIGGDEHQASIRLHEASGFEVVGRFKAIGWKHDQWLGSVYMQRSLGIGDGEAPE